MLVIVGLHDLAHQLPDVAQNSSLQGERKGGKRQMQGAAIHFGSITVLGLKQLRNL